MDETNDVRLTSWVASANGADCDFPIQNLPFGVFRRRATSEALRGGVAIGDALIDLAAAQAVGAFTGEAAKAAEACTGSTLNAFMAMGPAAWSALRLALSRGLRTGSPVEDKLRSCLVPRTSVEHTLPAAIGDYTDFYASIHHATSVGKLFRPDNPLLPNYKWIPVGYHGRSSSVAVSGQQFARPIGQIAGAMAPSVGPSRRLDYEMEVGIFIGTSNALGQPVAIADAESHIFGLCLLNDWSARDLQAWEYQPLGPFLSKSFATTISPWIVTLAALEPYRVAWTRPAGDPQPLPYLESEANRARGAFDIELEVWIETARMRERALGATRLSRTSFRHAYWTIAQMVAHHTVNGCNLQSGDLFGSGTQSGPSPEEAGSLLELSRGGKEPIRLPDGETRGFLDDGDTVIMRGFCARPGAPRIGFGEVEGRVLPART